MKLEENIKLKDLPEFVHNHRQWFRDLAHKQKKSIDDVEFYMLVDSPKRPRTTGDYSQNHAVNGYIQQICEETGQDFATTKVMLKSLAVSHGYPMETERKMIDGIWQEVPKVDWWGNPIGISESKASTKECGILIDTIIAFAQNELKMILKG